MSMTVAMCCSTGLAAVAFGKRALTAGGTLLAWLCCLVITIGAGLTGFGILLLTFAGTVAADKIAGNRADPMAVRRKSGSRGADRIFCNVGVGTATVLLLMMTGEKMFLAVYAAVMAESLADSLASKLGPLSKKETMDIVTHKPVAVGLSGGVTPLGTVSEAAGALLIELFYGVTARDWGGAFVVLFAGFTGALFDSFLGSRVQVKYRCPVCGTVTEREYHCGTSTERKSGWRSMSNDAVNFFSNLYAFMVAFLLLRMAA